MEPAAVELDLERVAELSRLSPGEEEREALRRDVVAILREFSVLAQERGAVEAEASAGPRNALREDGGPARFEGAAELLAQAPRSEGGLVLVPKSL